MGKCPECGSRLGPLSVFESWDNWGRFICPGCGHSIRFQAWPFAGFTLIVLYFAGIKLLNFMLASNIPVWLSFLISSVLGLIIIFFVPMMWSFKKLRKHLKHYIRITSKRR